MIMKYNARSHWSMGVLSCEYVNTAVFPFFEKDFMKAIKDFFRVNEYMKDHIEGWKNSLKLYKPEPKSRF